MKLSFLLEEDAFLDFLGVWRHEVKKSNFRRCF